MLPKVDLPHQAHSTVVVSSAGALFCGAALSGLLYWNRITDPLRLVVLERKFYFDEVYEFFVRNIQGTFAALLDFIDRWVVDFLVFRGSVALIRGAGVGLRHMQTGNVQTYAFLFGLGAVFLIWWLVL